MTPADTMRDGNLTTAGNKVGKVANDGRGEGYARGIEDAAREAEHYATRFDYSTTKGAEQRQYAARDIASRIRALADRQPDQRGDSGWIVLSGDGKRYRTWKDGWSSWTDDREQAVRYARREDAEAVHAQDDDAWLIQPYQQQESGQ